MEFDFFASLGFILGIWVLVSPGWRLARLSSQNGPLSEPLVENGSRAEFSKWLPSWFSLSVAAPLFWIWFFSAASTSSTFKATFIWSDASIYMSGIVILSVVINLVWILWLCLLDYKKTLMCVGGASVAFSILSIVAILIPSLVVRIYFLGCLSIGLTVIGNICRIMSQGNLQFSIFASSVALAGSVAGICWIFKSLLIDSWATAGGDQMIGFCAVFLKKNFFWKVSSLIASAIRIRDLVCLVILFFLKKITAFTKYSYKRGTDAEISRKLETTQVSENKGRKIPEDRKNYKQVLARSLCRRNHGRDHPPPPQDAGGGHEPPSSPKAEVAPSPIAGFVSRIRSPP